MDESPASGDQTPRADHAPADPSEGAFHARPGLFAGHWKSWLLAIGVMAALATLTWRRTQQNDTAAAKLAAQQALDENNRIKGPIDPFTFGPFTLRPSETDRIESGIKPGHWTTAAIETRANFDDFRGELAVEFVTQGGEGVDLEGLAFRLRSTRPALLAKMQKKILDVALFTSAQSLYRQVASRLLSPGGRDVWNARELLTFLPSEQFFFVVLAQQPEDYRYLFSLDSLWAPRGSVEDRGAQAHYRVLLPTVTTVVPLPSQALFWTNTAVLLWDGLDPRLLSATQQQALIDWLHWGGQLIVSGPDSLDLLRGSFLDGVLPAGPGSSWTMDEVTLSALAQVSPDSSRPLRVARPWTGQHLHLDQRDAHVLLQTESNEALVAERRIGRGRTVVTAFRLTQQELIDWPIYDAVFNAALLRRGPRRFVRSYEDKAGVAWADGVTDDSARVSQVRIFTRDEGRAPIYPPKPEQLPWKQGLHARRDQSIDTFDGMSGAGSGGVASWDDQSQASMAARESLKEAASIAVPRAPMVMYMLGTYVFVLVPLNWFVFRSLRRVEWAWIAAPVIAVVFGVAVVRFAQLNIGFDRSATEVAVLEVQGDYPRAHLTRYWMLYTSLSTDYTMAMENPTAVALPFASTAGVPVRQNRSTVTLQQTPTTGSTDVPPVQLTNLTVSSNATGMIHSEEMFALGGPLQLTPLGPENTYRLRNGTGLHLQKIEIVGQDRHLQATVGTLAPDAETEFTLTPQQAATSETASTTGGEKDLVAEGSLSLPSLRNLAKREGEAGELRLVAWTDGDLPGVTITPAATQTRNATMVIAHLSYGPPRPLEMDFNSRAQVMKEVELDHGDPFDNDLMPAEEKP